MTPTLTWTQALSLTVGSLLLTMVFGISVTEAIQPLPANRPWFDLAVTGLSFVVPAWLYSHAAGLPPITGWPRVTAAWTRAVVGAALCAFPLALLFHGLMWALQAAGLPRFTPDATPGWQVTPGNMPHVALIWFAVALAPALCEEWVFRGLVQPSAIRRFGAHAGVWITAMLFAGSHLAPLSALGIFPLALALGYITRRTGLLAPAIALHLVNNSWALALTRWEGHHAYWPAIAAWSALCGVVGLALLLWDRFRPGSAQT